MAAPPLATLPCSIELRRAGQLLPRRSIANIATGKAKRPAATVRIEKAMDKKTSEAARSSVYDLGNRQRSLEASIH